MLEKFRFDPAGALLLSVLLLSVVMLQGCSQQRTMSPGMPSIAAGTEVAPQFSLNTPVDKIAADRRGNAVLKRDVPGLLTNSSYMLFDDMSLLQIASLSCGRLTKTKLDQVEADLTQLSN